VAEGVKTAELSMELGQRYGVRLPICELIHAVVAGEITAAQAYAGLLASRPGRELDPD